VDQPPLRALQYTDQKLAGAAGQYDRGFGYGDLLHQALNQSQGCAFESDDDTGGQGLRGFFAQGFSVGLRLDLIELRAALAESPGQHGGPGRDGPTQEGRTMLFDARYYGVHGQCRPRVHHDHGALTE